MMFKVGMKCVCVDGSKNPRDYYNNVYPIKNKIYTVRGFPCKDSIYLKEIQNPPRNTEGGFMEQGFKTCRFRPLSSTTIEQLIEETEFHEYELVKK